MGKIGIHFEDVIVPVFQWPFESGDIGRAESQLPFTFDHVKLREFGLKTFDNLSRAVGRVVLYNEHIKLWFQFKNITKNIFDILFLVISRYDDNSVVHGYCFINIL